MYDSCSEINQGFNLWNDHERIVHQSGRSRGQARR